ncbi:MAG: transposase [Desulfuromonadales bacterium]|nr:transposase [Desulfuromonadales bacterium]
MRNRVVSCTSIREPSWTVRTAASTAGARAKEWKRRKALREQGPPRGRIPKGASRRDRMERKLRTKRGQQIYRERSSTVEPVFGQMHERGLDEFLLRGAGKARGEWSLFTTTHNLLKLWRSGGRPACAAG